MNTDRGEPIGRTTANPGANKRRLVLYLTGLTNSGDLHSRLLRPLLADCGDVAWAEYPIHSNTKFPGPLTDLLADEVIGPKAAGRALRAGERPRYDEVLLVAASLGALLAGDVAHRLWGRGYRGAIKAILVNPAHRRGIRKIPWRVVFKKPALEDGVKESRLFRQHMHYMNSLFGKQAWWKQMWYMIRHPLPKPGEFMCIDAFIVPSMRSDPLVNEESADAFIQAYHTVEMQSFTTWHADFPERPQAWLRAFALMLNTLYPRR